MGKRCQAGLTVCATEGLAILDIGVHSFQGLSLFWVSGVETWRDLEAPRGRAVPRATRFHETSILHSSYLSDAWGD